MGGEVKPGPWWGVLSLLLVVAGTDPLEAFGPPDLTGHHANWAARAYGNAVQALWNDRAASQAMVTIGAKVPRTAAGTVSPHLARLGITARETEVLRLVNAGLSNHDIAGRLFLSVRTVESHISSMLQKTGRCSREQLPLANLIDQ